VSLLLFAMANFLVHRNEIGLQIPYVERDNKVTIYIIHVTLGPVRWQVSTKITLQLDRPINWILFANPLRRQNHFYFATNAH